MGSVSKEEAAWLRWKALASVVAVPAGFGAVVGAAFIVTQGTGWDTNEWAAVVQAFGSIIGIGIAIYVPWKQDSNRQKEEAALHGRKAISMAILFYADLLVLEGVLSEAINDELTYDYDIVLPGSITARTPDIWMLGSAGDLLLQALTTISAHNRNAERIRQKNVTSNDLQVLNRNARSLLRTGLESAKDARKGLQELMLGRG